MKRLVKAMNASIVAMDTSFDLILELINTTNQQNQEISKLYKSVHKHMKG